MRFLFVNRKVLSTRINFFNLLLIFIIFDLINSKFDAGNSFSIISPASLAREIGVINPLRTAEIPYRIGKFGDVPFGKTMLAMIFIRPQTDGSNYWCNYDSTVTPPELNFFPSIYKEYLPMYLVDQGQCSYSKKAYNVQLRGGSIMLIMDDDNDLDNNDKYNILDLRGNSIKIPTLIIPKEYGYTIKSFVDTHGQLEEPVIVSVKFSAYNPDGTIEMNLFLSSDDINAIYFFQEFQQYKELLGRRFKFEPIYKYHTFNAEKVDNNIQVKVGSPCFTKKGLNYCGAKNPDLKITNPRNILLENLRQSCIYLNHGLDIYWKYMIAFGTHCANFVKPMFTEECSILSYYYLGFNNEKYQKIQTCMQDLVDFNSKADNDYQLYNYRKVYEYPLITLNGIKFKGMWLPRNIFNSICTSFINDERICDSVNADDFNKNMKIYPTSLIFFIITFLFFLTLTLVICYRRVAFRSIEQTLIEKIHTETIKSIGKYRNSNSEKDKLNEENK